MNDKRLDALLDEVREPHPADDGFTEDVVLRVRAHENRHTRPWRRFVTRPVMIAAAVMLVGGGALAAVRIAQDPPPDRTPQPGRDRAATVTVTDDPRSTDATAPAPARGHDAAPAADEPVPTPIHRDGAEYGYTSRHTSYAIDRGVRLETETFTNEASVGEPFRVRLTLANTTDEPVALSSGGCPAAVHVDRRDGASDEDVRVWNCGPEQMDRSMTPTKEEPQRFVLRAGESKVFWSWTAFPRPGEWQLVAVCRCMAHTGTTARPEPTPPAKDTSSRESGTLAQVDRLGPRDTPQPTKDPSTGEPGARGWAPLRLVTPPVGIQVT